MLKGILFKIPSLPLSSFLNVLVAIIKQLKIDPLHDLYHLNTYEFQIVSKGFERLL